MAGIFATAQPEYAALKIATFPFDATEAVKRGPLVSRYDRMGLPASRQMALRFPDAPGLAAMAGTRNRFTVIDIDERGAIGERLLTDVQRQFGTAKVITRTGSGGFHAYYRHNGEGRKIRPDPRKPIDLIGAGPIVLPPSRGFRGNYEIIHGRIEESSHVGRPAADRDVFQQGRRPGAQTTQLARRRQLRDRRRTVHQPLLGQAHRRLRRPQHKGLVPPMIPSPTIRQRSFDEASRAFAETTSPRCALRFFCLRDVIGFTSRLRYPVAECPPQWAAGATSDERAGFLLRGTSGT
jgi:hypothetical protein